MAQSFEIEVSGDIAGVTTLPRQISFAASRTINDLVDRGQKNAIKQLEEKLYIRGGWLTPGTRYGINATFAKVNKLEGSVHTAADWLLEEEGFNSGVKRPESGSNLTEPDVENTRFGIRKKVRADQKAFRLLAGGDFSNVGNRRLQKKAPSARGAFKVRGKYGGELIYQRVSGSRSVRTGRPLRSRVDSRNTRLVLKYVFHKSVKVPTTRIFTKTVVNVMNIRHFGDRYNVNLLNALKTAKYR